jgi:hypothetical protein
VTPHSPEGPFPASVHLSGRIGKAADQHVRTIPWLCTLSRSSGSAINSGANPTLSCHGHAGAFEARHNQPPAGGDCHHRGSDEQMFGREQQGPRGGQSD